MEQDNTTTVTFRPKLQAELFTVYESTVTYKSGNTVVHHDTVAKPSVLVLPVNEHHEIFLISEYRYLLEKDVLGAVAGTIEDKEKPLITAKKELKEEAGITAAQWEELARGELSRSKVREQMYIFLARDLEIGTPEPEEDEEIQVIKMPLEEAVKKVFTGEIYHVPSMMGILMLDKLRKEKKL